jgi:hypothetical protein
MPFQCNIDARGKRIRLINGLVSVAAGVVLLFLWSSILGRVIEIALILSGAFMIFESATGWCVLRAMGWKTPL